MTLGAIWDAVEVEELTWGLLAKKPKHVLTGVTDEAVQALGMTLRTKASIRRMVGKSGDERLSDVRALIRVAAEALEWEDWRDVPLPWSRLELDAVMELLLSRRTISSVHNVKAAASLMERLVGLSPGELFFQGALMEAWRGHMARLTSQYVSKTARALTPREWYRSSQSLWRQVREGLKKWVQASPATLIVARPGHRKMLKVLRSLTALAVGLDLAARAVDLSRALVRRDVLLRCTISWEHGKVVVKGPRELPILIWDSKTGSRMGGVGWHEEEETPLTKDLPSAGKLLVLYLAVRRQMIDRMKATWETAGYGSVDGVVPPITMGLTVGRVPEEDRALKRIVEAEPLVEMTWARGKRWERDLNGRVLMAWLVVQVEPTATEAPLVADSVSSIIADALNEEVELEDREVNINVRRRFTGHSLRQTAVMWGMMAGLAIDDICFAGGWRSEATVRAVYNKQRGPVKLASRAMELMGPSSTWGEVTRTKVSGKHSSRRDGALTKH